MSQPLVSIVIPCFNAEKVIADAIGSALAQTYRPIEVVVVDDGSTDASLSVIRSFGDGVRWMSGPNRGGGAARNRGLQAAKGSLIQFLDADDVLHVHKLERQVPRVMSDESHVVFCQWDTVVDGRAVPKPARVVTGDSVCFLIDHFLATLAPIHHRCTLEAMGGWREDLATGQDRDLHMRLAMQGLRFVDMAEALCTIRTTSTGASSRRVSGNYVQCLAGHESVFVPAFDQLKEAGRLTACQAKAFAARMATDARALLRNGEVELAQRFFSIANRMHPGGGLDGAYRPLTRAMRLLIGAEATERLATMKRQFWGNRKAS